MVDDIDLKLSIQINMNNTFRDNKFKALGETGEAVLQAESLR